MPFQNTDIHGVRRGRCTDGHCDCPEYICETNEAGMPKRILCCYCEHAPGKHSGLCEIGSLPRNVSQQEQPCSSSQLTKTAQPRLDPAPHAGLGECHLEPPGTNAHEADGTESCEDTTSPPNMEPMEHEPEPHGTPGLSNDSSTQVGKWTKNDLPAFSAYLSPLLEGKDMQIAQYAHQCIQLRHELIDHLDKHRLILEGNKAQLRWQYNSLAAALAEAYPYMAWETTKAQTYKRCRYPWSVFIHRVSTLRKQRRYRHSRSPATSSGPTTDNTRPDPRSPFTVEEAMQELEAITPHTACIDIIRIREVLRATLNQRQNHPSDDIPAYFLREDLPSYHIPPVVITLELYRTVKCHFS
ncbi:uncharacterized protein LOC135372406 [Ornithodoros turicata]|uniref:uncharacterized protein LOC135372406 n=1 Tax=Ornithodoros turicata TaxID=34597 RepID=UPI0031392800